MVVDYYDASVWSNDYLLEQRRQLNIDVPGIAALLGQADRIRMITVENEPIEVLPLQRAGVSIPVEAPDKSGGMSWGRSSAIYDAAAVALMRATPMGRRHLILVFTEGVDDASVIRKEQLLAIAGRADAVMHVSKRKTALEIAQERHLKGPVINVQYSDLLWPQEPGVIGDAARRTGGGVLNSLGGSKYEALSDIIARLRESYLIRYQPRGVAPGGWHDIRVTVPGQRYDIQARKGYWGG